MKQEHPYRKWILAGFAILFLALGIYAYLLYQSITDIKNLDVSLKGIRAEEFTLSKFTLVIDLDIYNPNKHDVTVGNFSAQAYSNDRLLATVDLESFKIPAQRSHPIEYHLGINYLDVGIALIQAIKDKQVTWRVNGEYVLYLPLGFTYPYKFNTERSWNPSSS